ncbi:HIRAN domain [Dillenia turbinata]|uniref:HIRAN domain n=1 Tax=Dillenia turbinata TaxID=194707 RepID=A0AAN8VYE4_9MAGN
MESEPLESLQETQTDDDSENETYMVGFVIANIVGIQHYSGRISGREMVGLVREPINPHDGNAIKVINTKSDQVGYIERSVAAVLAPLIDEDLIMTEGIVPKFSRNAFRFRIPCQIHIFARIEAFPFVVETISSSGLVLITDSNPSFTLSESMVVKEEKGVSGIRRVDEIFKSVEENVNKKGVRVTVEPPNSVIKSELYLHQKEGLGWLVHRENSRELPPFWEEKDGGFINVLTNYATDKRPEPLRGGIFADDMGMGKTLTLLALVALDKYGDIRPIKDKADEVGDEGGSLSGAVGKRSKKGRVSKASTARKKRKIDANNLENVELETLEAQASSSLDVRSSKTTLIVCPPSVFSSWVMQLSEHTVGSSLKMYLYYGGGRTKESKELQKYDIVLTSYSILSTEWQWEGSPLKKIEWWRIILDEAHNIKNVNARQSRAVTDLQASRRWVVTGTPIHNGSHDLFSLMAFLRFEPFSIRSYWQSLVQRPLSQGDSKGLSRLQILMSTISLRRTKDKGLIKLPLKTIKSCFLELSSEERELYDQIEGQARSVFLAYMDSGTVMRNYSTVLGMILRLRQICCDQALCPMDLKSLLPSDNIEDVSNNPDLLQKMVLLLQDGEDFECPICMCPPPDLVITCCAHMFCRNCILKNLKYTKACCPLCRHPLSQSDLFTAPPESSDVKGAGVAPSRKTNSSKVSALLKLLKLSRDQCPRTKSVIFSQFRKMLILLEEPLKVAGFKFLRLDGSMNAKKRTQVIDEFCQPGVDSPTILLASLKASGAGINLTAASRVYILEPWWNPAVEEQAMDRVHRIGQKSEVEIVRLIVKNSIEERILELQEKKKKLAREAFVRKGSKDREEASISDLRTLMSM